MHTIPSRTGHDLADFGRGWHLSRLVLALPRLLLEWQERAQQRYALATLDDRMLKDLGLDRAAVARELAKPLWSA